VPISNEGGPAKLLKIKNLENHHCDFEPGGRRLANSAGGRVDRPKDDPEWASGAAASNPSGRGN